MTDTSVTLLRVFALIIGLTFVWGYFWGYFWVIGPNIYNIVADYSAVSSTGC
jgi:hypothetical protein